MAASTGERRPVVDFHAHMLEESVFERAGAHNVASGFGARPPRHPAGSRMAGVHQRMLDPDLHIEDMDRLGIDVEVLATSTVVSGTAWADAPTALELNRRLNDRMAECIAAHPDRMVGSFTLPLQDMDLALGELDRAVHELGLRVANLPANIHGAYLGHPSLRGLWEAVDDLGLVVIIHPDGVRDPWFQDYFLWNSVGQPIEEAKVMASLIYEGVLDAFEGLRIVFSHGGGYLPHYFGRLDRNVTNWPASVRNISRKPSEYLRSFYYDTCVYEPTVLEALIARVGADRLVMGSDYPVGEPDPIGFVQRCPSLSAEEVAMVTGGTAAAILGLGAAATAEPGSS